MSGESVKLFFSYARADEPLRDKLGRHLSILKHQGLITEWHDRQVEAGTEWARETIAQLATADIILLLVSADFLASEHCWGVELQQAMARHETGEACVIPILLRPVDWHGAPFSKLVAYPQDGRPITRWEDQDEAFFNVVQGVRAAVQKLVTQRAAAALSPQGQDQPEAHPISSTAEATYRQELRSCLHQGGGALSASDRLLLDNLGLSLGLAPAKMAALEREIVPSFQTYAQVLDQLLHQERPLQKSSRQRLKRLQQTLGLSDQEVEAIETQVVLHQVMVSLPLTAQPPQRLEHHRLQQLLSQGLWQQADQETAALLLSAANSFQGISCRDLKTIDLLWSEHSQGRFGFRVQARIYLEGGGQIFQPYDPVVWQALLQEVGWLQVKQASFYFHSAAPPGHLPAQMYLPRSSGNSSVADSLETHWQIFTGLMARLVQCSLIEL